MVLVGLRKMWVRKISRTWKGKNGNRVVKEYYYWYKSVRKGNRVISQCIGPASEQEYRDYLVRAKNNKVLTESA